MFSHFSSWRVCVAPMLDWTDRHYRYFMRQITRHTRLYTEMVCANALLHQHAEKYLCFDGIEQPLALQLGGNDPKVLAYCARLAEKRGYSEVNLNIGCPSKRAQQGNFGACLMQQANQVSDCIKAMRDACGIEITIKHRIGVDKETGYDFLRDFVGQMVLAGCHIFIVHARSAVLGLSPKKNRTVPPLRHEVVHRLKEDYPHCIIVINGGIQTVDAIKEQLHAVDGVMIGREVYHNPYQWIAVDRLFYGDTTEPLDRDDIVHAMLPYIEKELLDKNGTTLHAMVRHMLNLYHGQQGARLWRHMLSNTEKLKTNNPKILTEALEVVKQSRLVPK